MASARPAEELTGRAPFRLGDTLVDPAAREVRGPAGAASVEPRVMQVLVALADAGGAVVTRAELIRRCWNDQVVGDDAINRAVGEVRRLARTVAAGSFGVTTITKAGYRLTGAVPGPDTPIEMPAPPPAALQPSRRALIGTALGLAASGIALGWQLLPAKPPSRAAALLDQGQRAMRDGLPDSARQGVGFLREAATLAPDDASVWGALALAWRAASEYGDPATKANAVAATQAAARRALDLDARQPDAHAALALLQPDFGDWLGSERRLQAVLALDPVNEAANAGMSTLLQSVGRSRASAGITLSLAARQPLAPTFVYHRSYALWILGRLGEADRNIDRAIALWPQHPAIWFTRLWLLSLTGRAPAALAMLNDPSAWPLSLTQQHAEELRASMIALASRRAADVRTAVATNLATVMAGPSWAVYAVMILTRLGELDAAFEVANGYLLRTGAHIGQLRHTSAQPSVNDQRHRKTMMLFIPPTTPLRADPRFLPLCEAMGLGAYWRAARVRPDFLG